MEDISNNKEINIISFGDIYLGGEMEYKWLQKDSNSFISELNDIINKSDLRIGNIETSFYRGPLRINRGTHLYSPPESIAALKALKLDIASIANNHTMDFGTKAMIKTKNLLTKNGIKVTGAGLNRESAAEEIIVEKNHIKIGFLSFTSNGSNVNAITATKISTGCAPMKRHFMLNKIHNLRNKVDVLIIMLHWGFEFINLPAKSQRELARELINNGVDVILGTHPHVIQAEEIINNKPVFYSLGNFIFPQFEKLNGELYTWKKENNYSIIPIINIKVSDNTLSISTQIFPVKFHSGRIVLLKDREKDQFFADYNLWNDALKNKPGTNLILKKTNNKYKQLRKEKNYNLIKSILSRSIKRFLKIFFPQNYLDFIKIKMKNNPH